MVQWAGLVLKKTTAYLKNEILFVIFHFLQNKGDGL
jgi:hypothetical protein